MFPPHDYQLIKQHMQEMEDRSARRRTLGVVRRSRRSQRRARRRLGSPDQQPTDS